MTDIKQQPKFTIIKHTKDFDIVGEEDIQVSTFDNWSEMAAFVKGVYEAASAANEATKKIIVPKKEIVIPANENILKEN